MHEMKTLISIFVPALIIIIVRWCLLSIKARSLNEALDNAKKKHVVIHLPKAFFWIGFVESIFSSYDMRTTNQIIEKALQLHDTLMGKTDIWETAYMCLELLLIVAQKEEVFDWEKVPHIQSILNVFDRGNKKLEFMYNIIIEPHSSIDTEKKHYSVLINNGTILINMIDIWSLLWIALGGLFPNNLLRDVRCINSAFGDTNVDYINGFIEYARKFQKLCAFIQ